MNRANKNIGIIQMVLCSALWSIAGLFISHIHINDIPIVNGIIIAAGRSFFAAITVVIFMVLTKQRFIVSKNTVKNGILLCGVFICFVGANKLTTEANAIVLQYTAPIFVLIFSAVFLHKKPRGFDIAAVLLTLVGVACFFLADIRPGNMGGNLLAVAAGAFFGGTFVAVGNTKGEEKMSGILFAHIFCTLIGLPFLLFAKNNHVSGTSIALIAVLGVVQLGIPYILYALASNRCSTVSCVVISAIEPVLNPILVAIDNPAKMPNTASIISGLFLILVITLYSVFDEKFNKKSAC